MNRLGKKRDKHAPVGLVGEDRVATDASRGDVHDTADRLEARRAAHVRVTVDGLVGAVEMALPDLSPTDVSTCLTRTARTAPRLREAGRVGLYAASAAVRRPSSGAIG